MNFEGKSKIGEPVLQAKGLRILPFIIHSSLFDIRYSFRGLILLRQGFAGQVRLSASTGPVAVIARRDARLARELLEALVGGQVVGAAPVPIPDDAGVRRTIRLR